MGGPPRIMATDPMIASVACFQHLLPQTFPHVVPSASLAGPLVQAYLPSESSSEVAVSGMALPDEVPLSCHLPKQRLLN